MHSDEKNAIQKAYFYLSNGALQSASEVLQDVLTGDPEHADALQMLGVVYALSGKPRQAADLLRRASERAPENGALLANLARASWDCGEIAQAALAWDRVIALGNADADAWSDRGTVLRSLGGREEALASLEHAILLQPHHLAAWTNRGNVLHELDRFDEALVCHEKALTLQPDDAAAWMNKGSTLDCMQQFDEALACYETALALNPGEALIWSNRGVALRHAGKTDEALASFDHAIALDASCINAWINRGTLKNDLHQYALAVQDYDRALAIAPEHADAQCGEALARLAMGDYEVGWQQFEARWKRSGAEPLRHQHLPLWLGAEDLAGKRILLWAEQGLGDTLQFCRYISMVGASGCTIVVEVPATLQRLLQQSLPGCQIVSVGEEVPPCDFQTPLLSLPLALKTRIETIPGRTPYLFAATIGNNGDGDGDGDGAGKRASAGTSEGTTDVASTVPTAGTSRPADGAVMTRLPRIGIACSGSTSYAGNRLRSMPLAAFAPLQKIADLVLLQQQVSADDAIFLRGNAAIVHTPHAMGDFAETAAIACTLDLIISVDTALAHLAGAMALPVWVLLPWACDWRWQAQPDTSPWYPGMRLFRQERSGDWDGVIVKILGALAELQKSRR
ncbi:MAG: tetratricopeptide repeat protein [Janthinobacterium lividum]